MYVTYEIFIFAFILLSFFFSSCETAVLSANLIRLRSLADQGNVRARRAVDIIRDVENTVGMILIGNNTVNIASSAFIIFIAAKHMVLTDTRVFIITAVETVFFLVFCEIFPKVIARNRADAMLMAYSLPIRALMKLLLPLTAVSSTLSGLLKKLLDITGTGSPFIKSRDEIETLFSLGKSEGIIRKKHQQYVDEILNLHKITVKEIMTPTIDMVAIERGASVKQLVALVGETRFSRIPVYEDRVDNVVGYVYYRDLLDRKNVRRMDDIMRRAYFVPSTKKIDGLFAEMQENDARILFAVNEYGGVEGLVTTEDIVEELVGEIQTRDHPRAELIKKLQNRKYLVSGEIDIEYFQYKFGFHANKQGFETLAGFVTWHLGRIPAAGETFGIDDFRFQVNEATEKSVESVTVTVPAGRKVN
ncbi:MAG: HlyC/CorC family transporter [Spirochaetes bacterium]|nr:HlyC/CorC family transporter [Spirochaetota bacterium]